MLETPKSGKGTWKHRSKRRRLNGWHTRCRSVRETSPFQVPNQTERELVRPGLLTRSDSGLTPPYYEGQGGRRLGTSLSRHLASLGFDETTAAPGVVRMRLRPIPNPIASPCCLEAAKASESGMDCFDLPSRETPGFIEIANACYVGLMCPCFQQQPPNHTSILSDGV